MRKRRNRWAQAVAQGQRQPGTERVHRRRVTSLALVKGQVGAESLTSIYVASGDMLDEKCFADLNETR